jgi:hypothetical protein
LILFGLQDAGLKLTPFDWPARLQNANVRYRQCGAAPDTMWADPGRPVGFFQRCFDRFSKEVFAWSR